MKRLLASLFFALLTIVSAEAQQRIPANVTTLPTTNPQEYDILDNTGNWAVLGTVDPITHIFTVSSSAIDTSVIPTLTTTGTPQTLQIQDSSGTFVVLGTVDPSTHQFSVYFPQTPQYGIAYAGSSGAAGLTNPVANSLLCRFAINTVPVECITLPSGLTIPGFTSTALTAFNTSGGALPAPTPGAVLQVGSPAGTNSRIEVFGVGSVSGQLIGRQASGTYASPAATGAGIPLLSLAGMGYVNGAWTTSAAAGINITAYNAWTPTDNSSTIRFFTTPINSTALAEVTRIQPSGGLSAGNSGFLANDYGQGNIAAQNRIIGSQIMDSVQVTPEFCSPAQIGGGIDDTQCVQNAINYACSLVNSQNNHNIAGEVVFARGIYYIEAASATGGGLKIPKNCGGLQLVGQGFGGNGAGGSGLTNFPSSAQGTYILSDNNCTSPIINFYNDATANYVYGGAIRNIGFWNNTLTTTSTTGATSCLYPLIQVNYAQQFKIEGIYSWTPYAFIKLVGGLFIDINYVYGDQALQDSPGLLEFTGWGAKADATGQLTRQDQVHLRHVMMYGNTAPQAGHKLPVCMWQHGFAVSLKTFDTECESVVMALKIDCTTTGIAATQIQACPAYDYFFDFETEGGLTNGYNMIDITDAQNIHFKDLYAVCLNGTPYCNDVMRVYNTTFQGTAVVSICGGQLNGAGASGIDYLAAQLYVGCGTNFFSNDLGGSGSGGSDITLEAPGGGILVGNDIITGNFFCNQPYNYGTGERGVNIVSSTIDFLVITNNSFMNCSIATYGTPGSHNSIANNVGP